MSSNKQQLIRIVAALWFLVQFILFWTWFGSSQDIKTYSYVSQAPGEKVIVISKDSDTAVGNAQRSGMGFLVTFYIPFLFFTAYTLWDIYN